MGDPVKVLMIEDALEDAELLVREMRKGGLKFVHERVDTRQGVERALERFGPDVILSDYAVPGFGGMSALEIASQRRPDTPFIFVSGTIGEERAIEALKRGATDYVLKDNRARLVPSILRALKEAEERGDRIRAERAQRASEERFRSVAEASQEWIWDADAQGLHTYCNHAVAAILGYEPDELVGVSALDYIHEDDRPSVLDLLRKVAAEMTGWRELVLRWRHKDGSIRWLESNALPLLGPDGEVIGYRGAARDITHRIEQQEKIARLSRIHAMFSGINSTIVRILDRQELLRETCRIAVADGKFRMALVGVIDAVTGDGSVMASAGVDEGYTAQVRLTSRAGLPYSERPACRALREKMPVICNDIATDPTMAPLRGDALARGYRSAAAFPLLLGGDAHAVLVLYAGEPNFFDQDEVKLLKELAADITFALDHMAKAARLNYVSNYDTLTGLANRQFFFDRLAQMIHSANSDRDTSVIVVDLQRFSTINDTLGRSAGDTVLKQFADSLQQTFGPSAMVARMSGDRFAVAVDNARSTRLAFLIHDWIARSQAQPMVIDGSKLHVSFKLGISFSPADGVNAEVLFHNAEAALQRAKDTTDTYVFYSREMNARVAERLHFESRLRKAVDEDHFLLHYQPKVDLETRRILGLEALMRWRDPENGFVSPLEFIPVLEQTGLIIGAGKWVIEQVVTDMERWRAQKLNVPRVAVNVSQVQVRQKDFVATVLSALGDKRYGRIDVDLEITESLVMDDALASIEKLSQLRAVGMRIFMDDFGTGYSSLSQIAALPLDALKIDRAFVAGMGKKPEAMAIVSTIISLARALKIGVVAEGVETEEQAGLLAALGCDQAQGYLFSRPVAFDDMASLLSLETAPA